MVSLLTLVTAVPAHQLGKKPKARAPVMPILAHVEGLSMGNMCQMSILAPMVAGVRGE
jgi:hypothetical protein